MDGVIEGVEYDRLLSHPDMKRMRLDIYWDDTVSVENDRPNCLVATSIPEIPNKDDVAIHYPELL